MLNFGHTFAHSIEMSTEFISKNEIFRHGEAVGLGMMCEIYFVNGKENSIFKSVRDLLMDYKLPVKISDKKFKFEEQTLTNNIFKNIFLDKKRYQGFLDSFP